MSPRMSYPARINVRPIAQVKVSLSFVVVLDSSEYSAACDERRAYISGFNGSAGEHINATLSWSRYNFGQRFLRLCCRNTQGCIYVHGWTILLAS